MTPYTGKLLLYGTCVLSVAMSLYQLAKAARTERISNVLWPPILPSSIMPPTAVRSQRPIAFWVSATFWAGLLTGSVFLLWLLLTDRVLNNECLQSAL